MPLNGWLFGYQFSSAAAADEQLAAIGNSHARGGICKVLNI